MGYTADSAYTWEGQDPGPDWQTKSVNTTVFTLAWSSRTITRNSESLRKVKNLCSQLPTNKILIHFLYFHIWQFWKWVMSRTWYIYSDIMWVYVELTLRGCPLDQSWYRKEVVCSTDHRLLSVFCSKCSSLFPKSLSQCSICILKRLRKVTLELDHILPGPAVPDASTFIEAPTESRHLCVVMKPCEPWDIIINQTLLRLKWEKLNRK